MIETQVNKKELKRLRKKLTGYYLIVAHKAKVTKAMVSMVLGGKAQSQNVIDACYDTEQLVDNIKEKAKK